MPTPDNISGINDTNALAAQQDSESRLSDVLQNNPKQFVNPNNITQPEAPKGLYGTVDSGENINIDKTSYAYNAADYNNLMKGAQSQYPGSNKLPDINLPQSETERYTGNDYGYRMDRDNESFYANQQGLFKSLANSGVNFIGKTVAYAAQNAGFILGAPIAVANGDISNMTDNFLTRGGDWLKDKTSSAFPIYKSDKYTQGNIWQKLGTLGWWADDAMDRVALTAAMFLPGLAEAKGFGLFGTALDETGALRATGVASKALQSLAENPSDYGIIGKTFLSKLYNAAAEGVADSGTSPALRSYAQNLSKAELFGWNIIGQSGLNAKETQEAIMKATGDKDKAAEGAMKSFWETVPLALAGSLVEIPQMFSTVNTAKSVLNKILDRNTGETLEESLALKAPSVGKTLLKSVLTGFEHGQNESMQVAVSRFNEEQAEGKDKRGALSGIFGDFLNNIHDPNGQNNIALGTIQGILMTLGGKAIDKYKGTDAKEQSEAINVLNIINQAKLARRFYNEDFNKRDDNGNIIIDANGKPAKDQDKMADAGLSLAGIQNAIQLKKKALEQGRYTEAAFIDHKALSGFAYPFFSDANGMEHLTNILKLEAKNNEKNPDRINDVDEFGNEITPQVQLQKNLNTVSELRKVYNAIDQRHAGFTNLKIDKNNKSELQQASNFIQDLKNAQYVEASNQIFLNNQIQKNQREIDGLGVEGDELEPITKLKNPSNPIEEKFNDLHKINSDLREVLDESKERYKQLVDKKAQREVFNKRKEQIKQIEEQAEQNKQQEVEKQQNQQQTRPVNTAPPNQTPTQQTAQQTAPVQTQSSPEEPKISESQKLLNKRNEDLANAKTEEEKKAINKQYLEDLIEKAKSAVPVKSVEETEKAYNNIKGLIPKTKNINKDELTKLTNIINNEIDKGNITTDHEAKLIAELDSKNIVGTIFDKPEDFEDETEDKPEESVVKSEGPSEQEVDDGSTVPSEDDTQAVEVDEDYNPETADSDTKELESELFSSIAFQTSNKTVTQEEKKGETGRFNNVLDEDPYKQFIQGFLRHLNQNGFPVDGLHGKIIKDNDNIPHSQDTIDALNSGVPYGSVLVVTDMNRNILYFDEDYNSDTLKKDGSKPIAYSFTSQYWDDMKKIRAEIGEERTGTSEADFLKQYEEEQEQQKLARELTNQDKEVNVEINGISKGVERKFKEPKKSSEVITEDMKPSLYIPPTPIDKFDPENPVKTKYVIVGNKALINGALYAETLDNKSGIVSYTRLIPNKIGDMPELFENIKALMSNEYKNRNEATIVRDHLKDLLFLGKVKRPNLSVFENEETGKFNLGILQDNIKLDPEVGIEFISEQRMNISRVNVLNDEYNEINLKNGSVIVESKQEYKKYVLENSTTVDIPIRTTEGNKFVPLNTYASFQFLDSLESMKMNLQKGKNEPPGERELSFEDNETPVFRHGENNESATSRNSGTNPVPLNKEGIEEAKDLGKLFRTLGIKKLMSSNVLRAAQTAKIAAKEAGIKNVVENSDLRTWDKGDFTSLPDNEFDERWFVLNPDETVRNGMKLGESFNSVLNRLLKVYKDLQQTEEGTAVIAHSTNIRIWDALKENNGFWNDNAVERFLNLPGDYGFTSIVKQEVKKDNSTLVKPALKRLGTFKETDTEKLAREQDEKDKGLKAIPDQRENRPLLEDSEINKVNDKFGHEIAKRVEDIINSDARAIWTLSGIKLSRDARQGDGYHEAWHHFSQLYLSQQQKRALYDEARKKDIDFKTRDNRKLNSKTASDFDLEEFIADDYRDYELSGGKSRLVERPYRNNIFRKIYDFIKSFFFGDVNVAKLYDDLYKGNLNKYQYSTNNAMWGKLNSRAINQKGDEIVDNQKAAYYRDIIDYLMGEQLLGARTSVESLRKNKKLAEAIYKNIYNELVNKYYNPLLDKADKGEDINQTVAEDLFNILSSWEDFVQYHKQASKLFLNIKHELAIDVPENPEDITTEDQLGEDNYEIKESDEEGLEQDENKDIIQSDKVYDIVGNEKSSLESASIQTRGLIRMLPAIDYSSGKFTVKIDDNGFPRLNDYAKTWNNLAYELSNLSSYQEMIQKMNDPRVMKKIPELNVLLKHLPSPNKEHTPSEINTILAFRTDFNRAYVGIYSGKMYADKGYFLNEETKRNNDQVRKVWTDNFFSRAASDDSVINERILTDEQTGKYYLNPGITLNYNLTSVAGREQLLNLIGFSFSDEAKTDKFYKSGLSQYLANIQDNINLRHQNGQKIYNPIFDLRNDLIDPDTKEQAVKGLGALLNSLVYFQAKYASDVPSLSYQTATGEMIYGLSLNHTVSITVNTLNKAKTYDDIKNNPATQHLNLENNPYVRGSIFLNYLFNTNSGSRSDNNLIVGNYNGLKLVDNEGETVGYSTTDLNVRQKAIFDISSLLTKGIKEIMRTESSKSAYFVKLHHYVKNNTADPSVTFLPVGLSELPEGFQSPRLMRIMIDNYLYDELNRMKNAENVDAYKTDPKLMQAAQNFNLFRDILRIQNKDSEALKNSLKSSIEKSSIDDTIEKHRPALEKVINDFFLNELKSLKDGLEEENIGPDDIAKNIPSQSYEQRLRAFVVNDFILNVEYTKLFDGDTIYQAQYKDYFKRSKGGTSTGKAPMTDDSFVRYMKSTENNTFGAFVKSNITNDYKSFRTINFKDDVRTSKYIDTYKKDLLAADPYLKEEDINRWLDKYKDMKIADGQGYITLDFYRQFLKSINNWSDAQEMGYKVELAKYRLAHADFNSDYDNEMRANDREFLKQNPQNFSFYPPLKIQYHGPIAAKGTFASVMDKFSVVPLIPSIITGTPLEQIHNEMLKHGIGYSKYVSGTKKYVHTPIEIYNEDGFQGLDLSKHKPATHFLDYLKEQINTNPEIKYESIFGSQIRKLIEANLFNNSVASKEDEDRHERYKSYIQGVRDLGRQELFNDLGLKEIDGRVGVGDVEKFVSTLQEQAELRELNDNIKDYIQYDKDTKKLKYALETSLNRRPIQDLIMGIVDRRLRVQKLNGDQLIQISSSGYQSNDFKYKNATEEEVKKYGTNGLRFYHLEYDENGKPKSIVSAQVKVGLNGGFEKLLQKLHPDGKKIDTLERLNQLLKDENWVKENKKLITIIGYRIPTQGHNSMEHLEIAEFLPPHVGSSVIVPSEIVAKSGSDFDIDKLSMFRPSLDDKGNLVKDSTKQGYSNKIIDLFSEILSDPKNFKQLIRPNDTDLVKPETNEVAVAIGKRSSSDIKDPKPYSGTQIYRYKNNLRKFETLLSAKKLLSIFAVNNTFTTLMQQAGTTHAMNYGLKGGINRSIKLFLMSPKERETVVKSGRLQLGQKFSVDGNYKQDFYSQLINATVDAASDDFFGYANMSYENVNVLCHLINQGVPFDRAIWFLNSPVLLRYYSDMRKREKGISKDAVKATILGELTGNNYFNVDPETGRTLLNRKLYNSDINKVLNNPKYNNLFLSKDVLKKYTVKNKDVDNFLKDPKTKTYNAIIFSYFISLQEQAQLFRNFQRISSYDTTKTNSPTVGYQMYNLTSEVKANKMFDENEINNISTKSIIAPFDSKKFIMILGATMMPVAFNPVFMMKSVGIINKNTDYKSKSVQKKFINNYETQWVEYLVKSLGKIGNYSLQSYSRYLLEGKNNLARRFNDLISKYPSLKDDYALVDKIRPNFPNSNKVKKSNLEVYRLFENTSDDQNRYIQEFRNLINLDSNKYNAEQTKEIQTFFKDLAILGFAQSGFTKSNISFQELIPYEQLADVFKTTIDNFKRYIASDRTLLDEFIKDYITQFTSNQKSSQQPWRGRDFFLTDGVKKAIAAKTGKEDALKYQVNQQSEPKAFENTVNTNVKPTKTVNFQMQPNNIEKILKGEKTTTIRSEDYANKIGLKKGESAIVNLDGKNFIFTSRGLLTIDEAGGQQVILQSEGLTDPSQFKYQQSRDWYNGKGKLVVYDIKPEQSTPKEEQKQLLEPPVKTERQYWPGSEVTSGNEIEEALGKAEFKYMMEGLSSRVEAYFMDIPENTSKENFDQMFEDDTYDDHYVRINPENFERMFSLQKKFGNNILADEDYSDYSLNSIEKNLRSLELHDSENSWSDVSGGIKSLFQQYKNGEYDNEPHTKDQAEKILSDYGLLMMVDYNPNQLKLFTEEEYKNMLKECKGS